MAKDKCVEIKYKAEKLRRNKVRKALRKEKKKEKGPLVCPQCHRYVGYYVREVIDPFYEEMYGTITMVRMCDQCYQDACGDI